MPELHRRIRLFFRRGRSRPRTVPQMDERDTPSDTESSHDVTRPVSASASATCPACGAAVTLPPEPELGEVLDCAHCGAELEVIGRNPIRLDLFEEEEK